MWSTSAQYMPFQAQEYDVANVRLRGNGSKINYLTNFYRQRSSKTEVQCVREAYMCQQSTHIFTVSAWIYIVYINIYI